LKRINERLKTANIIVFSSGGGGNFKYLAENQNIGAFKILSLVVDVPCNAETVASDFGIPVIKIKSCDKNLNYDGLLERPELINSDIIVLAGFMPIVPISFIKSYGKVILNTHPSLLPAHGGRGMYGVKVQESVIKNGDQMAGCTCHIVDEGIDTGQIISQRKIVVDRTLTPWELGGKVFELEGPNLIDAINIIRKKRISREA
jgi:phosphoribosylglycinamide formyltransferase-1